MLELIFQSTMYNGVMVSDEILVSIVVFGTVLIPNLIFIVLDTKRHRVKNSADLVNASIRILIKTLIVTIISTIVTSLIVMEIFIDSDPGAAVAVLGIWMVEAVSFILCSILTAILLLIVKRK